MSDAAFEIIPPEGVPKSTRRQIVFLSQKQNPKLNVVEVFNGLEGTSAKDLKSRMDHWIGGYAPHKKYHHGWNVPQFKVCYVFKWITLQVMQRMYGFLAHPYPTTNPSFLLCVLCQHATKTGHETDKTILKSVVALHNNPKVQGALAMKFTDVEKKGRQ